MAAPIRGRPTRRSLAPPSLSSSLSFPFSLSFSLIVFFVDVVVAVTVPSG
jgi:hypothetical protein